MSHGIFSRISEATISDILQTLQAYTGIPIQLLDPNGTLLLSFGSATGYCALLKKNVFQSGECLAIHMGASRRAQETGEAYVFSCHASLDHIAYPLQNQGELIGSVILGPFVMDTPDSTLVSAVAEKYTLSPALSLELYDELGSLQVITPPRVQLLKKMMEFMLSPLIQDERALLIQVKEKLYQQSRINETIQIYKEQGIPAPAQYFFQREKELLTKVRTGSISEVKGILNDLIGYVLFSQGGNLESVRIRSIELTTLLSRVAMDGGARVDSIYELNNKLLPSFFQERNLDALCFRLQEVAENFMDAMFSSQDKGNHYIRKAMRYMADHYAEHVTLESTAEYVQLSPSYFSSLFREVVGISFRQHLCNIRVEESKQLLLSTDYSLADIAVAVGFPDQSYFCKAFKRVVGLTPGKFRS